jgi:NitT/TauT family transport system substrate-binding protein
VRSIARTLAAAAALAAAGGPASAHHWPLIVQLNMPLQAAVAGYFVADYQGFYDEAEITVSLVPGGPGVDSAQLLADGHVNMIVERMPAALAEREQGVPLVNIGQVFARSSMRLVCRADSGITAPADLRGRKLGVWSDDNRHAVLAWLAGVGLDPGAVTLVDQNHDAALLLEKRADCISAMSYDEEAQLVDAGVPLEDLVVLRLEDYGPTPLEDGIWVQESLLADPDMVRGLASFLYASRRGWEWARASPVEAVRIVQEYGPPRSLDEKAQVRRMHEVNRLTEGATGRLDSADFERTVELLLAAGPDRAITRRPEGAWTHAAADEAGLGGSE